MTCLSRLDEDEKVCWICGKSRRVTLFSHRKNGLNLKNSCKYCDEENSRDTTLNELAKEFGCTRERVRQIEASALRKLRRNPLARQLFRELYE